MDNTGKYQVCSNVHFKTFQTHFGGSANYQKTREMKRKQLRNDNVLKASSRIESMSNQTTSVFTVHT